MGRVMAARPALVDPSRPSLIGLKPVDPAVRLRAGAHFVPLGASASPETDQGYLTSAAFSPKLGHWIGLGLLTNGPQRVGERIRAYDPVRSGDVEVEIVAPVFIDPTGESLSPMSMIGYCAYLQDAVITTDYGGGVSVAESISMKILFLDINGVLNRFGDEDGKGATTERFDGLLGLDARLLKIYKTVLSRIDVTVVLSSSWRLSDELRRYLTQHGVYFDDVTPCMSPELEFLRGREIQLSLNKYSGRVERYAILDDQEDEMLEEHMPNFFHAPSESGLTQELADRIVVHLSGERGGR